MANLGKVVYLSEQQKKELFANNTITVDGVTINYSDNDIYATPGDDTSLYCSATLSSAGWYRVMQTKDVAGTIINFYIGRPWDSNPAETHKISFHIAGSGKSAFLDETSNTNTLCVDKIRVTYGGGFMYFDVHYNTSSANEVLVYFDVYGKGQANGTSVAMGLASVADAPSGETVLTEYVFAGNTSGNVTSSYSITKLTGRLLTLDSAYRYGKVVHMQITAASSSAASEGSNIATGTLNGAKPSVRVLAAAYYDNRIAIIMINTDGAITVRLSKGSMESSYTVTFGFTFICS